MGLQYLMFQMGYQPGIPVISAQAGVAIDRSDMEQSVSDFQNGHIEGSSAQIPYQDVFNIGPVQPISQRRRRGFTDDSQDLEPGHFGGFLSGPSLGIAEIRGNRNHGLGYRFTELAVDISFDFSKNMCGDFLGRKASAVHRDSGIRSDQAFDGTHGSIRIGRGLVFGDGPHQDMSIGAFGIDRWGQAVAFGIL